MASQWSLKAVNIITSLMQARLYWVAAELGLADHLATGPKTLQQLAELTNSHPESLFRILRALTSGGCFSVEKGNTTTTTTSSTATDSQIPVGKELVFSNNDLSNELLRSDGLRYAVNIELGHSHYEAWGNVMHTVRTGESAFENRFGLPVFDYLSKPENEKSAKAFENYTSSVTNLLNDRVVASYDWSSFKKLVDIGGGRGALVAAVASINKNIEAIIFDQEQNEDAELATEGIGGDSQRIKFIGGDFFEGVPAGGDIYTIKWILHDWDDEKCGVILDNIYNSIEKSPHSRLLVLESIVKPIGVVPTDGNVDFAALLDTNMMTILGGKERTEEEFQILLREHGFTFLRSINIHPFLNIVEAKLA